MKESEPLCFSFWEARAVVEKNTETIQIKYMQYLNVHGPTNYGYIVTTLQYDPDTKHMEAVAAEYVE